MSLQSAMRYGIRGLVSAVDGALQGQVAAAESRDAKTFRDNQLRYQQRMLDLEEQKLLTEDAFKRAELGEQARQADQSTETQRMEMRLGSDGKLYEVDTQAGTARYVAELDAASKANVAEIGAKASTEVAEIGAKASTEVAEIRGDADRAVAETRLDGVRATNATTERIASDDRAMTYDVELLRAQTQMDSDNIKRDIAEKGYASAEKIAQWTLKNEAYKAELEAQGKGGGALSTVALGLTPAQVDRVDALASDYRAEKDYQAMEKMQREYERAVNAYNRVSEEALDPKNKEAFETGAADVALINIFQRFIDPGVSVREGDVELLQKTEGIWAEWDLLWKRVRDNEGFKLTPQSRKEMFQLVTDFYTAGMSRMSEILTSRYQQRIDLDGELRDSGVTVSHLGTDYWERYGKTLAGSERPTTPAEPGDGDPDTPSIPQETPTEPPDDEGAWGAPGTQRRENTVEALAKYAIDQGWGVEEVRNALAARNADEDIVAEVLARFAALQEEATPKTQRNNRGVDIIRRRLLGGDDADE